MHDRKIISCAVVEKLGKRRATFLLADVTSNRRRPTGVR